MKKKKLYLLALLPFALIIFLFEILPILMVLFKSVMPVDSFGFTLEHYYAIFSKKLYQMAITNSILVSIFSSMIGIIIGFFGAKALQDVNVKTSNIFSNILNMTSNFSGIPLAFAYIIMLGNVGVFVVIGKQFGWSSLSSFNIYSLTGLLLCYVYFQIPLATLLLAPAFEGLKNEWREAVELLGGRHLDYWLRVGLPNLLPSLLGTFSVLFANAVAAYATAYALMQNSFSLLPIRISEQFVGDVVQQKEFGSALSVILMFLIVLSIAINQLILRISKRETSNEKRKAI